MGVLESLLVRLVVGLLGYLHAREDLKRAVLAEAQARQDQRAMAALRWLSDARARADSERLRVREGQPRIRLPGEDPGPNG